MRSGRTKLIASFIVMAMLMAIVGVYGLNGLGTSNANLKDMYDNQLMAVQQLLKAQSNLNEVRSQVRKLYMTKTETAKQTVRDKIIDTQKLVQDGFNIKEAEAARENITRSRPDYVGWIDLARLASTSLESLQTAWYNEVDSNRNALEERNK